MSRALVLLLLGLCVATGARAADAPADQRTQEALQRYNAGVAALERRDLEYALNQFRQAVRLNPGLVEA